MNWVDRQDMARRQNDLCYLCKCRKIRSTFQLDRKKALCNGGGNSLKNLGLICRACHKEKTKKDREINRRKKLKNITCEKEAQNNTIVYKDNVWYDWAMKKLKRESKNVSLRGIPSIKAEEIYFTKVAIYIRLDKKIVDHFKETGKGWQSRMNYILGQYVDGQ